VGNFKIKSILNIGSVLTTLLSQVKLFGTYGFENENKDKFALEDRRYQDRI
jgi:hypothetical protein